MSVVSVTNMRYALGSKEAMGAEKAMGSKGAMGAVRADKGAVASIVVFFYYICRKKRQI